MNILEDFFYGNITPNVMVPETDKALREAAQKLERQLRERLSEEEDSLFIEYSNKELSVYSESVKNNFLFGLRFGMLMMMEIFQQSGDLIG